ncbi:MAG: DUF4301 family protein [Bacteroidales bacterium]|nr:DUF4301 family protein [Bacteroidales bacterium]
MATTEDQKQIEAKGMTLAQIEKQLKCFEQGFNYLEIVSSASVGHGILAMTDEFIAHYEAVWNDYLKKNPKIVKFVPASGAASRMFKDLFEFLNASYNEPTTASEKKFFDQITCFAFYEPLNTQCTSLFGKDIPTLIKDKKYKDIVSALLTDKGLNYGAYPKGLLLFHKNENEARIAMAEHFVEGALYAKNQSGAVSLHFTVSPEHRIQFEKEAEKLKKLFEKRYNVKFDVTFSEQKPNTDTIAVDKNNQPIRENGHLIFRPGGHGALIENLNDIDADIIFIKNIDNVVPDTQKKITIQYKKVLAGILVETQQKIWEYLEHIDSGKYTHPEVLEMIKFMHDTLCIRNPEVKEMEDGDLILHIKEKLNRPIRVCGMVRNQGEAGGGPFLTVNPDGSISPQILESSQINLNNPLKRLLFEKGTHFNPVDLVCATKDYQGNKFDLLKYVDPNTGFISLKSKNGVEQKALELPGLWNGAMSDWNSIFVEVPIETFNPVKSVNDLLRKEHQPI